MMLSNKKLANPFVYQGYESPAYFCDREAETKTLLSHLIIIRWQQKRTVFLENMFYGCQCKKNT